MRVAGRVIFLLGILSAGSLFAAPQDPSTAHIEALIQRLGTGNINDEDAAKSELQQHPAPEALPLLLKAPPSSEATVRNDIIDILASSKDKAKIPALIAYRANDWGEKNVDPQLVELGAPAVDALVKSLPGSCDPGSRTRSYADWVGTVLREIEPDGTRAMLSGLATDRPCMHEAARSGLVVPRPGPPMAPEATAEEQETDAGLFLLVDAADSDDRAIRETARNWIRALESRNWSNLEYSPFLETIVHLRLECQRANRNRNCPIVGSESVPPCGSIHESRRAFAKPGSTDDCPQVFAPCQLTRPTIA
ncbi:MAG TPA: hypothetical protein VMU05_06405 [Dongiaceae bacterium]|nr:hypothetical protein [Dongiaceae bacterium]